jgi:hypothetical protein
VEEDKIICLSTPDLRKISMNDIPIVYDDYWGINFMNNDEMIIFDT